MDIRRIDLNLLRAMDALLAERNVSRAAARLHLSQPAMSALLKRLREAFGDSLFTRGSRGVVPTARAIELGPSVRHLLHEIGALFVPARPFDPARDERTFSIATTDYVQALLMRDLAECLRGAPGVRFAITSPPSDLAARLESGALDLAILNGRRAPATLRSRTLIEETFVVAAARGNRRVGRSLSLDRFCALDHVLASPVGGGFAAQTDEALAALARSRKVRLSVQSFEMVVEVVATSPMIAVLPRRLALAHGDRLKVVEPPLALPGFTMAAVWHERVHRDAAVVWLRGWLSERLGAEGGRRRARGA